MTDDNVFDLAKRRQRALVIIELAEIDDAIDRADAIKLKAKELDCSLQALREEVLKARKAAEKEQRSQGKTDHNDGYSRDRYDEVIPNFANVNKLLDKDDAVRGIVYWDKQRHCMMQMHEIGRRGIHTLLVYGVDKEPPYPRRFIDDDYSKLLGWVQQQPEFAQVSRATIMQVVDSRALAVFRHPIKKWLEGLVWDRKPRVDLVLANYFGVEINPYTTEVSRVAMMSIVQRIQVPGCKQDYSLAIEGEQGELKSKACEILAVKREYYTNSLADLHSRDSAVMGAGKVIIELPETVAAKRADVNTTKAALSRENDEFINKYEKHMTVVPRQSNFIGTGNDCEYFADATGNRRWMPVKGCVTRKKSMLND